MEAPCRKGATPPTGAPTFSLAKLQQLYERLSRLRELDPEKGNNSDAIVETIRQITEALIWSEQNNENFFDFFCEKSILEDFITMLGFPKGPKKVKLQLLQTLSMLVQNIRCRTSVFYLLSNNHVNRLIGTPLDFQDEETLAYYITLMKSLAMRLDNETIHFFFIQHPETRFPLYIEATKFFSHEDQMVSTTVRAITLQVYRIEDQAMRSFVMRHAQMSYFSQLAYHLHDVWLRLDAAAVGGDLTSAQRENELQQDLLIYLSDMFELGLAELNEVLADRLLNCAMLPLLLSGVAALPAQPPPGRGGERTSPKGDVPWYVAASKGGGSALSPGVALFLARQVVETFHTPVLVVPLVSALLHPVVPAALAFVLPVAAEEAESTELQFLQENFEEAVPNTLRPVFLRALVSDESFTCLLAASIVHGCIRNGRALSRSFLESANVLPPQCGAATSAGNEGGVPLAGASSSSGSAGSTLPLPPPSKDAVAAEAGTEEAPAGGATAVEGDPHEILPAGAAGESEARAAPREPEEKRDGRAEEQEEALSVDVIEAVVGEVWEDVDVGGSHLEVLLLILQALTSASRRFQPEVLAAHARLVLEIFSEPSVRCSAECRALAMRGALVAVAQAAADLQELFHKAMEPGSQDNESLLEIFMQEWESQEKPLADATAFCSDPRHLLRNSGGRGAIKQHSLGKRAVMSFFLLRQLLRELATQLQCSSDQPGGAATSALGALPGISSRVEPSPLDAGEPAPAEGSVLDVTSMEKKVCGVAVPDGGEKKCTYYILLHQSLFLLAQPHLLRAGCAEVKTAWPVWLVQTMTDRSDPRVMRVHRWQELPQRGQSGSSVSGAGRADSATAAGYTTLILNFDSVKSCHSIEAHLQARRLEGREKLRDWVLSLLGQCRSADRHKCV